MLRHYSLFLCTLLQPEWALSPLTQATKPKKMDNYLQLHYAKGIPYAHKASKYLPTHPSLLAISLKKALQWGSGTEVPPSSGWSRDTGTSWRCRCQSEAHSQGSAHHGTGGIVCPAEIPPSEIDYKQVLGIKLEKGIKRKEKAQDRITKIHRWTLFEDKEKSLLSSLKIRTVKNLFFSPMPQHVCTKNIGILNLIFFTSFGEFYFICAISLCSQHLLPVTST